MSPIGDIAIAVGSFAFGVAVASIALGRHKDRFWTRTSREPTFVHPDGTEEVLVGGGGEGWDQGTLSPGGVVTPLSSSGGSPDDEARAEAKRIAFGTCAFAHSKGAETCLIAITAPRKTYYVGFLGDSFAATGLAFHAVDVMARVRSHMVDAADAGSSGPSAGGRGGNGGGQ